MTNASADPLALCSGSPRLEETPYIHLNTYFVYIVGNRCANPNAPAAPDSDAELAEEEEDGEGPEDTPAGEQE